MNEVLQKQFENKITATCQSILETATKALNDETYYYAKSYIYIRLKETDREVLNSLLGERVLSQIKPQLEDLFDAPVQFSALGLKDVSSIEVHFTQDKKDED
jgi:hypothetical protein